MKDNFQIDFVIPWVDGSDPRWIAEFNKYAPQDKQIADVRVERYRDNGLLKYWFRGVEKFAPWVHKVHFVTCGQKPEWLNLNAPKLHFVNHSDYIPSKYLPVFSSHPIELMMHKIPELAEQIVYFNDDLFLTAPVRKNFFFKNGLPCDSAIYNAISASEIAHILFNDIFEINTHFAKRTVLSKNPFKWLNPLYGIDALRTFCLLPWPHFTGFVGFHIAQPYLKSALEEVWENCADTLERTMQSRFRNNGDVNQYLFRYWQLCKGYFSPTNLNRNRKYFSITDNIEFISNAISSQKYAEIILNDGNCSDYQMRMIKIHQAFEEILPEKSSFEL